jgi:hypothetical protein
MAMEFTRYAGFADWIQARHSCTLYTHHQFVLDHLADVVSGEMTAAPVPKAEIHWTGAG